MSPLGTCPHCNERSTIVKRYRQTRRVEICINIGCGFKQNLPDVKPVQTGGNNVSSQISFQF